MKIYSIPITGGYEDRWSSGPILLIHMSSILDVLSVGESWRMWPLCWLRHGKNFYIFQSTNSELLKQILSQTVFIKASPWSAFWVEKLWMRDKTPRQIQSRVCGTKKGFNNNNRTLKLSPQHSHCKAIAFHGALWPPFWEALWVISTLSAATYLLSFQGSVDFVSAFKLDQLVGSSVQKHASACDNAGAAFSYMDSGKLSKPAKTFFPGKAYHRSALVLKRVPQLPLTLTLLLTTRRLPRRFLHYGSGETGRFWQTSDPFGRPWCLGSRGHESRFGRSAGLQVVRDSRSCQHCSS